MCLPLPRFLFLYVDVCEWQFGQIKHTFDGWLFSAFPSLCSSSKTNGRLFQLEMPQQLHMGVLLIKYRFIVFDEAHSPLCNQPSIFSWC